MGRGIRSNKITGAVVGAAWFLVALLTLLGAVLNRGSGKGYERPTPVNTYSVLSLYVFADGFYSAVLVLDWGTLPQMAHIRRIHVVLDDPPGFYRHLHPALSLEPWKY
jgi:hypothetical protein